MMRQLGTRFWLLVFAVLSTAGWADLAHQENTGVSSDGAAAVFWKNPSANIPADPDKLVAALSGRISQREALLLRGLLETDLLTPVQREAINVRLTLYVRDLADRDLAPGLSEEARRRFRELHFHTLTDTELKREIGDLSMHADELVAHALFADPRTTKELMRLAGAVEALRHEETRRQNPGLVSYSRAGGGAAVEDDEPASAATKDSKAPAKKAPSTATLAEATKALVKKIPVGEGSRDVLYVDPDRWTKDDTIVIAADYTKPGVDNPGAGMPGAIANSVQSFRAKGVEVLLAGSPEDFDRAALRVQERLRQNPKLKVVLNAHGHPGEAHFGPNFELTAANARQLGEKLKGVSEIFLFSCSFGGIEEPTRLLAEGAGAHVMSSNQDMYAGIGEGNSPGVRGSSSFVHGYPSTMAESEIRNPKFAKRARLVFDPDHPGENNGVIRPEDQRVYPPDGRLPPEKPRDPNADGDQREAYRSPERNPAANDEKGKGNGTGGTLPSPAGNPGVATAAVPMPGPVPVLDLPSAPKDLVMDLSNAGAPREVAPRPKFNDQLVYQPLLPTLRKAAGGKSAGGGEL